MKLTALALASLTLPLIMSAATYSANRITVDGISVIQLLDPAHHAEVRIAPGIGNIAYAFEINGKNALWMPPGSLAQWKAKPNLGGVPFLAPWANRLDENAFYANGKKYALRSEIGNVRPDQNGNPIHGLLLFSDQWQVVEAKADGTGAHVTSRLEFWKHPDLMAQFPFAHTIEMTYRLADGALEVETVLKNLSTEAMPVGIGFHPYFQLHDTPRDEWQVHLPVRDHLVLSEKVLPTGEVKPMDLADPFPLRGHQLDDGFGGIRESRDFWVQGRTERITVHYGERFPIAVVYAPRGGNFICFEPMSGITNAFNMAHKGLYKDLQTVAPGAEWRGTFRITPTGF